MCVCGFLWRSEDSVGRLELDVSPRNWAQYIWKQQMPFTTRSPLQSRAVHRPREHKHSVSGRSSPSFSTSLIWILLRTPYRWRRRSWWKQRDRKTKRREYSTKQQIFTDSVDSSLTSPANANRPELSLLSSQIIELKLLATGILLLVEWLDAFLAAKSLLEHKPVAIQKNTSE